jgi:hypothetical protein
MKFMPWIGVLTDKRWEVAGKIKLCVYGDIRWVTLKCMFNEISL